MTVNLVSESFLAKEQGVHTAFLTNVLLVEKKGIQVSINSFKHADITHIHTVWPFALLKMKTSRHVIVTAHIIPESLLGSLKGDALWFKLSSWYLPWFYNSADLVLAVSPLVKQQLLKLGVTSRIEVFPNPVDTEAFCRDAQLRIQGRKLLAIAEDTVVVLASGQIQPRKGITDFIRLAKEFPEVTFVWVGGKPFKGITAEDSEMNDLLAKPPKNFLLRGPFVYSEMPAIYNAADVFVFPSFQENAPMSIIEAAACGLPLVLRDNPEYKMLYGTGYLACDTLAVFAKALRTILAERKSYIAAQKASLHLAEKYSIDTLGDSLIRYYKSIL